MSEKTRPAVIAGGALGLWYIADAFLKVGCLSLIFPILGGALATYLYSMKASAAVEAGDGAKLGALTGVIGGLIVILVGTPLVYFVLKSVAGNEIQEQLRQAGLNLPFSGFLLMLIGTLIMAVVGLVVAAISGMVTALILKKR